jgi:basic membrane lipoprotein Med (substrate-binding protein (PBP1-ABC) superfamily)
MGSPRRLLSFVVATVALALIAVGAVWLSWPSGSAIPGASRVRHYDVTARACLLTGSTGLTDPLAAAAWAGLQGASTATSALVSYLPVPAPATGGSAKPYLASLVQRQCGVIVAVGSAQVAAVRSAAASFGQVRFIAVTASSAGTAVTRIAPAPAAQVHLAVQAAVSAALHD